MYPILHEWGGFLIRWTHVVAAIAWIGASSILAAAPLLYKLLGHRALTAIERLMGMLLVAISVQMFLDGLGTYFKLPVSI